MPPRYIPLLVMATIALAFVGAQFSGLAPHATSILGAGGPPTGTEGDAALGSPGPLASPCATATPQPGAARPWESQIQVATYSSVNTLHGNVFTVIPIIGWFGRGPSMNMALYHNSANVDSALNLTEGMGFSLGEGWSTSYSDLLILDDDETPTEIIAIAEDGTQTVFEKNGSVWDPPAGVHDTLEQDGTTWTLTHKNQSYHEFEQDGVYALLSTVGDAFGNALTVVRDGENEDRIDKIVDDPGRELRFEYTDGMLTSIHDPNVEQYGRTWSFTYDEDDRLEVITDPMPYPNPYTQSFDYDVDGRIVELTDKDGNAYEYSYAENGQIDTVFDPVGGDPRLDQSFVFDCGNVLDAHTTYTDRRGNDWLFDYNSTPNLVAYSDPLEHGASLTYDSDRNVTDFYDGMNEHWEATYDSRGNLLTLTDPLDHVQTWTYDSLNNRTSYEDALENTWTFNYASQTFPTALTSIVEPADGQGNDAATTAITYCETAEADCYGKIETITGPDADGDPYGVWFGFEYDTYGQPRYYREGRIGTPAPYDYVYSVEIDYDKVSRMVGNYPPIGGGQLAYNPLNMLTGITCDVISPAAPTPPASFPKLPCNPDSPGPQKYATFNGELSWTPMGRLQQVPLHLWAKAYPSDINFADRTTTHAYDYLGRQTSASIVSNEHGLGNKTRAFAYDPDWGAGTDTRTGPDGIDTVVVYDEAGRVESVRRGPILSPLLKADYTYNANNLVTGVSFFNGASVTYDYDDAGRLTHIQHKKGSNAEMLEMYYYYTVTNLPSYILEYENGTPSSLVQFTYDDRGRLIREERSAPHAYDWSYEYDQAGNRTKKVDNLGDREWVYVYDTSDPGTYGSNNNRLMEVEEYDTSGNQPVLEFVSWYFYSAAGNVTRVVRNEVGTEVYTAHRIDYGINGEVVLYVMGESW
jgi:YD repeat-containing protein